MTFQFEPGDVLSAAELNQLVPPSAPLLGGTGTTFSIVDLGSGLALGAGLLTANWQLGTIAALLGLAITGSNTLHADWEGGPVNVLGSGLSLNSGTLSATGSGGSVTSVAAGAGLSGGPITTTGTLVANYQAGTLASFGTGLALSGTALTPTYQAANLTTFGPGITLTGGTLNPDYHAGVLSAFKTGLTLTAGTLAADWEGGPVNVLGLGVGLNSGTLSVKSQVTVNATAGATIALAPTGSQTNYMINGPAAGGTVTLTGSMTPGQTIVANVSNGATASVFVLGAGFQFSSGLPSYTSTPTAGRRDIIALICNVGTVGDVAAINQGFTP